MGPRQGSLYIVHSIVSLHLSPYWEQATSNKQPASTSQPHFGSGSSSGSGASPKLCGWVTPLVAFSNPSFGPGTLRRPASAPATPPRTGPKRGQTDQNGPKQSQTAPWVPQSGSVALCGQLGAHGTQLEHRSTPLRNLRRPFWAVIAQGQTAGSPRQ